ncbi:MAG: acyl-ACP--UDP-N-acetylglucosamine O-acyltransferase [Elusimicrobia bacterium]|nr:acyl-ACP--UDP-N-acetylglucosamine O-acyltransferase [Elusimicrobiota bacterium]
MTKIHPTAIIHSSAQLAEGVEVGPYTLIGEDVVIGPNTWLGPHCVVEHARIGRDNKIHAGACLGTPPQDFKYNGEPTLLILGDKNIVREYVTLNRGTTTGKTVIGNECMFMAYSHVGHDCRVGNGLVLVNSAALAGHVEVGDNTIIGGMAGIHQFARIGSLVMLGAGAMAGLDIPPFCTAQGDRAKIVGLNLIGMRRAGIGREGVSSVKEAFKTLFSSGWTMKEAVEKLKSEPMTSQVALMVDFIEKTKRGITGLRKSVPEEEEEPVSV